MAKSRLNLSALKNFLSLPNDPSQPLTRFDLIRLKNWMLIGIFLSNIVAKILMDNFLFRGGPLPSAESMQFVDPFRDAFRFVFFLLGIVIFVFIPIPFSLLSSVSALPSLLSLILPCH